MSKKTLGPALLKMIVLAKVSPDDIHTLLATLGEMSEDTGLPKNIKKPMMALLDALNSMSLGDMAAMADGDTTSDSTTTADDGAAANDTAGAAAQDTTQKDDAMAQAEKAGELQKKTVDMLTTLTSEVSKLSKRIETLEKQPAPAKGNTRAVTKEEDGGGEVKKQEIDPATASVGDLIKLAHSKPMPYMQPAA
jgi:hypothetical protein